MAWPFPITKVTSLVGYWLELPTQWRIHFTFHINNLKRYPKSEEFVLKAEPPPLELVEGQLEYGVEAIIQHRGTGYH